MVEECERQFTASAESRPPNKHGKSNPKPKQAPKESEGNTSNSISQGEGSRSSRPPKQVRCFQCKQLGHRRNECPKRTEATGRNTSNTAVVGADTCENRTKSADAAHLFVEQLEQLLAQKCLEKDSSVACVAASLVQLFQLWWILEFIPQSYLTIFFIMSFGR